MSMKGFNIDDYEPVDNTSPVSQGLKGLDLSEWEPVEDSAPSAKATQPLAKKAPEEEGLLKEFGKAGMRGAYGIGEMFGNLAKFVDYDTGKAITDWANKGADEYAMGKESSESLVKRGVLGGVESMPSSVAAGAPGALAGATIGSFGGPLGTWLGGAIGYGASGGTVMGLAEYQNYLDEYRKATGKDPDFNAKSMAVLSALAEGGFEGISNFLEGLTLGAGRGVVRPAATTLKEILKTPLKSWAKRFVAIEGIESATEAATAYSQALTRQAEGLPTMEPLEAAKEAILPAMTMGGMFTLGGAGLTRLHRRNMEKNLTDPSVAPQDRAKAVDYIADLIDVEYGDIGRVDTGTVDDNGNPIYRNEIADLWRKYGIERILAGEPINLDFMVDRISLEAELLQSEIRHDLDLSPEDLGETAGTGTVDEATAEAEEAATIIPQTPVEEEEKTPTLLSSTEEIIQAREETGDETTLELGKEAETAPISIEGLEPIGAPEETAAESPPVESKPEDTGKVSPEPEKTSQEATGVKPEEVKGEESEQKRTVSDDMKDGKITTLSGRVLTPPTIRISTDRKATKDSKRADEWLRKEAIQEAKNRNDDYVLTLFRGTTPANLSQSDREFMHDYLFGEEKKIFVLEEEKPGTKTKGVIDNGEGMQETEGTEGQIKPTTEEGATPETPPKKPAKAAPSSSIEEEGSEVETPETKPDSKPSKTVAEWVMGKLSSGERFDKLKLFKQAEEAFGGKRTEGKYTSKDAFDAMELGINRHLSETTDTAGYPSFDPTTNVNDAERVVKAIRENIMDKIPSQAGLRSEEQDEYQQFSTPPDLAYVMNWVANIKKDDTVLEPSAGIGGLAVFAKNAGARVIVNELSQRRAELVKEMGFDEVYNENAEHIDRILPKTAKPTVIIMNPPFSATAGRIKGQRSAHNIVKHVSQALKRLEPNGRIVILTGKDRRGESKIFNDWIKDVRKENSVLADITVSGKGYKKYGTTYDTRIIVIDKIKSDAKILKGSVEDVKDAIKLLEGVRDARIEGEQSSAEPKGPEVSPSGEATARPVEPVLPATGDMGGGERAEGGLPGGRKPQTNAPVAPAESNESSGEVKPTEPTGAFRPAEWPEGTTRPRVGGTRSASGDVGPDLETEPGSDEGLKVEKKKVERAKEALSDSVYESYKPQKLTIKGAQQHPGKLVESAAMAVVEPPDPTYSPRIPEAVIKRGDLSLAQLEAIVYAGQAHQEMLTQPVIDDQGNPTGEFYRKGYFIGDGTGVGKGREIAGIIRDNFRQGRRKAIWISQNAPLIADARRDVKGTGWSPDLVFDMSKTKLSSPLSAKEGIAFLGYDLLKSRDRKNDAVSRLNQLVEWFGKDFDGVVVFDESHNMGNALAVRGLRGMSKPSAKAMTGVELQRLLPNARVVYVSATGATEVMNLSYADRLGLWGEGTSFASKQDFVAQIASGGIAAMEFVARDMKAMGNYLSRSLSYEDVKYDRLEHQLTSEQREVYDELASAWQLVLARINEAMEGTGASHSPNARSAAMSAFWGSLQRFFNQVITSMQTPAVVQSIEKDLENGHAVVIQLVNTNEAAQERALAKMEEGDELEDLDLTPRDQLMQYVRNSFPVAVYEEVQDPNNPDRTIWVPVLDSNGNPVEDPEAVAMREALLDKLGSIKVPDGPLEIILNHFGHEKVAEITGRSRRVVTVEDEKGKHKIIEKRSQAKTAADADAFMGDKKPILVFSDAGGTGRSYHADLSAKNQKLRRHYLLQAGWRADRAIQGFGRTHRSSQKQAPEYILVTTDIIGQKRFISSIARRLDQLGALTRGQRETGSGGFFTARDNLESVYAQDAVTRLVMDIYGHAVPGWDISEFMAQTGLTRLVDPRDGSLNMEAMPPVTQFLNRLLAMNLDKQVEVFELFSQRLDANIRKAMVDGTLDVGLETLRAKRITKASEQIIHTDEKSGAETKYVQLDVTKDAYNVAFNAIPESWQAGGFYRNIKSGQVWAASASKTATDAKTGHLSTEYRLRGPKATVHEVTKEDLEDTERYERLSKKDAQNLWDTEFAELPREITYQEHFVTGALLPIWDRLQGRARIMKVQTDDGERMIGRLLDPRRLSETLRRLGATVGETKQTPADIFTNIKDHGFTVELSNGWKIKRVKVSGEFRIEIIGPDYRHLDELKRHGAYTERIQWETRLFIPVSEQGTETIRAIIATRPVVNTVAPLSAREDLGESPEFRKDFVRIHGATKGSLFWTTDLKKALARQVDKFSASTGVKIEIIQNNHGFPRDFIERAGGSLDVENDVIRGAYDSRTNTVYIVADGIDSVKMAEQVIIEEIVGHKGLKALLKPLEMSMVRLSVYDQFKDTPMMREIAREYGFDTGTLTGRAMTGNEFMVHHMPSIYEKPSIMNKLTSFIRRALRKIGFTVRYSEADIRVLMNRAWENMRGDKAQLKGEGGIFLKKDLGGEDQKMIDMSPEFSKTVNANSEKAASPEEAYHKNKSFKERLKESLGSDIGWFVKHFYNPFFKGQKIPAWKRAVDISENRRENRTELNHQYFSTSRDFYGLQGESLRKLEKVIIEGDATLPYKHADMLKEAKVLKEGGNLEGAKEMREKARQLRALNRYSDEELKEGVTVEGGEKIALNDKEIEIYKSIRSMFDQMHNDWYVNQMNLLLRRYENESWFKPFVDIYSQRDVTPEMAKLWKTINRFAFNNYKGKKDKTIQKKRQADIAVLADHFGDTVTAADLVNMAKVYRDNISTMNQIRKARNRLGKWIAYFPRVRGKGKYYLNVYEVIKDVNEETGEETERRSLIFNTTFRNAQEGEKIEKDILSELKGMNVAVELGEVKRESEQSFVGASDMNLQRLLDNAISKMKGAKGVDPDTLKSIKGSMIQAISNELKARGFAQHSIRRKWKLIKGYETTGLQKVLRDYITGFTGMSTKQEAAIDFLDLMQTIDRKQTNLYEDISKYARDMLRNQEALDRISGKARGYAFIWYLGANIRPMLLQLTQNYVTGMPFLKEKMREWGVKGTAEKFYHKAMIDAARTKIDSATGEVKGKALNKWEKQMIKEMLAKGIAEDQYIQEITGQMRSKVGRAYDKALYYLSYPFSQMEIFNRKSAGLAMFRIAWDKYSDTIKNEEDRYRKAFEEAKEYIYKTHYAYGKENLPRIATGGDVASIGSRTALTFRSFTHNYLLSLVNSGDWKTIAHSLAYVAVFGGLLGLPLIGDILDLLEKWTGKSYKKSAREILRKFGGRTLETFGMHGLPALAGVNISGSMAIGIPFVGETPADTVYGVMGGLAQKGKLAVQSLGRGDVYRALENAAPEFVANPMKAYRMATTGATTQRGKRIYDEHGRPVKLSASEAAIKTVGFNPSEYSAKNEAQRSASNIQEYFSDWKTNIYESYRVARLNHNVKAQNDAMKDIRKFNQAVREKGAQDLVSLIKLSNVVKAAREKQTKKQRRESRFKRDYVGG